MILELPRRAEIQDQNAQTENRNEPAAALESLQVKEKIQMSCTGDCAAGHAGFALGSPVSRAGAVRSVYC